MIKYIDSKENKIIKYVYKLRNDRKFIKSEKKYVVEGDHFLDNFNIDDIDFIITNKELKNFENINQYIVNDEILKKLSINKSFSSILIVMKIKIKNLKEINISRSNKPILFLDNLQDPGNIGTILRTMASFSYFDLIIENYVSIFNSKTLQASQGALSFINIYEGNVETLKKLKENNYKIVSTTLSNDNILLNESKDIFKDNKNIILVFGNEGNGISKDIVDISDYKIKINIANLDSLNVAIACAITLYQINLFTK